MLKRLAIHLQGYSFLRVKKIYKIHNITGHYWPHQSLAGQTVGPQSLGADSGARMGAAPPPPLPHLALLGVGQPPCSPCSGGPGLTYWCCYSFSGPICYPCGIHWAFHIRTPQTNLCFLKFLIHGQVHFNTSINGNALHSSRKNMSIQHAHKAMSTVANITRRQVTVATHALLLTNISHTYVQIHFL